MGSKEAILVLGLLAMVFLISSEVAARDLAEASSKNGEVGKEANEVGDAKYGGYGGGYPGGGGGYGHGGHGHGGYGHGGYGGGYPGHGGGHGGGYCRYGCCGGYYGGHCGRCCSYAGEAVQAKTEAKPHN